MHGALAFTSEHFSWRTSYRRAAPATEIVRNLLLIPRQQKEVDSCYDPRNDRGDEMPSEARDSRMAASRAEYPGPPRVAVSRVHYRSGAESKPRWSISSELESLPGL